MSFTIREIEKYSKIQYEVAEWAAERIIYICKVFSDEIEEMSKKIENQKEVFEKEHSGRMTMKKLAFKLRDAAMSDIKVIPNLPKYNNPEITQYKLELSSDHVVAHVGLAFIDFKNSSTTCSCFRLAESIIKYFEDYNLSIVFMDDSEGKVQGKFFIDVRTNGIIRPEDSPFYPL